jgi:hypothetical protein
MLLPTVWEANVPAMTRLPQSDQAILDIRKIEAAAPGHGRGADRNTLCNLMHTKNN